ncbi:hypothetical protein [Grimontia marina]|uniref:Uncharacterized protein n=1 Tax=Grimontia marina TaxID=646534 RepID=A0A128FI47_9GAMM|nr:hypothetical protein [Grimontia marina]CZF85941.1 hypothetical protein GMA8713_03974 [Grimontia marina]
MSKTHIRLLITAVVFVAFTLTSTAYYMTYIHDVGGTYWSLGVFGLPVVLFAVWCIDFYLKRLRFFHNRYWQLAVIDCVLAVAFYYPGFVLTWWVILALGIA